MQVFIEYFFFYFWDVLILIKGFRYKCIDHKFLDSIYSKYH